MGLFRRVLPVLLLLAAAQAAPSQAQAAAVRGVQATGAAWGSCMGAASKRLIPSGQSDEAILDAAFAACTREEARARKAYATYLRELGEGKLPKAEMARIFADARAQARRRIAGCLAMARAAGDSRQPC